MKFSSPKLVRASEQEIIPQDEAISFLSDRTSYTPEVDEVVRVDTHAAIVFLAGKRAYKIKRAVRYNYLDFSTLEKRHAVCERELERNLLAAPDIYLAVIPIVRLPSGELAMDHEGEVIEWVVVMNRFRSDDLFSALATSGKLDRELMIELADTIAAYHARARKLPNVDANNELSRAISSIVTSLSSAADLLGLDKVRRFSNHLLEVQNASREILQNRVNNGFVRLCHGDLHLDNIVLFDGRPTLFDAIEFDDAIASIDVLYDFSFVIMDLWRCNLRSHANALFNRYLTVEAGDSNFSGLALLPMYLSLRAGIRAMVMLDRLPFIDDIAARKKVELGLKSYFELAQEMLIPTRPQLIAVGGRSGSGKSTVAAELAPAVGRVPGAVRVRTDVERKALYGVAPGEALVADAYTREETGRVYQRVIDKTRRILAAGHSVILDATFLSADWREHVRALASKSGAGFKGIWLEADVNTLVARVTKRSLAQTDDPSDADANVVAKQICTDTGAIDWHHVRANGDRTATFEAVARIVRS